MASDDCDDQELCKFAAEFEDREYDQRNSDSRNSEMQDVLHTNGEYTPRGTRDTTQFDSDWDDEWDNESFPDVHIQHVSNVNEGARTPAKSFQRQVKRTREEFRQENKVINRKSMEPLDNGNKEPTLNDAEPTAVTSLCGNQVIGNLASHPRGKDKLKPCESCRRLSLEKCSRCENNELASASDEEVYDWLDEESVSDLELSFAAEEVESTAYQ